MLIKKEIKNKKARAFLTLFFIYILDISEVNIVIKSKKKKENKEKAKCSTCGIDMDHYFAKNPIGICETCHKVYCVICTKALKKGRCPSCNNKVEKRKMRMKEYPAHWVGVSNISSTTNQVQIVEKVIIKEIVKIPCPYCKTLVLNTESCCPSCGGIMNG